MSKNPLKWLYRGIKVKRWLLISFLGVVIIGFGAVWSTHDHVFVNVLGIIWIFCGMILMVLGIGKMIVSLLTLFLPKGGQELVDILYQKSYLERGPKIVTIGGGTGLSNLIFSLKEYTSNITAIVTVADSGGSSGKLREEFNIVAPGDIRNCLVALADAPALMGELFQFRFSKDSQLQGHNFGNLFLTAMVQLTDGDFERAVQETSKVLSIRGKVVPSTIANLHLIAEYMDGTRTEGEARIPNSGSRIKKLYLTEEDALPTQDALDAIEQADIIMLGPGSLFTSIIPNLIIKGMSECIAKSQAFKIYVCNVMTQQGETDGFSASDHLRAILEHAGDDVVDACVINNAKVPRDALAAYEQENAFPVDPDDGNIEKMGVRVFATDLLGVTNYVRHDSKKLMEALIDVIETHRVIRR